MIIKLIRHGESEANAGKISHHELPDANIPLSEAGIVQATDTGQILGQEYLLKSLIYTSPYIRTKQTLSCILQGSKMLGHYESQRRKKLFYEDPRLREVERGYNKNDDLMNDEEKMREREGWFYYRFAGGESPADCYDRISTFIDSMTRQMERKRCSRCAIVSHGLTIRCFVMRWMHLTVEQFKSLRNPQNCDIITITDKNSIKDPQFVMGKWGVSGLRFR